MTTINERLKHFRVNVVKMPLPEFSVKIKVPQVNYYSYEKGSRGVPDDVYRKLFEIGCDLNWLITGTDSKKYSGGKNE